MGYFYFDESIHTRGGFIIGAFVYSQEDLTDDVFRALREVGLVPTQDEFKSHRIMNKDSRCQALRDRLKALLQRTKVGLVVLPIDSRGYLVSEALIGLEKILLANFTGSQKHCVYFDEGIRFERCESIERSLDKRHNCTVFVEQDSRVIGGLQLADLAAHCLSIMLLEALGVISKTVKTEDYSGYDPDLDITIGFELWATLRYCFFKGQGPTIEELEANPVDSLMFDTGSYALYVSQYCSAELRTASEARFSKVYLGCIH